MYTHQALAADLLTRTDTLFGLIGDANLYLVDSFRDGGGKYVAAAHEAGAVLMALGYAQATGRVGVATVTHGPAMTNTVTALVEGVRGRIPLVLLAGDTPVEQLENLQDIEQRAVVEGTGAGFEQMRAPRTAVDDLDAAFRRALVERRPVVLNMPVDFQWREEAEASGRRTRVSAQRQSPDRDVVEEVVGLLAHSSRPLVLAGRGAIDVVAREALVELAARLGAPLATTLKAKGLFQGRRGDVGIFGTLSTPGAADTIARADTVIAFGAGLNRFTTSGGDLFRGKRVVQVDSDEGALSRHTVATIGMLGDAALSARAILRLLDEAEVPASGFVSQVPADASRVMPAPDVVRHDGRVDFPSAIDRLEEMVPADRILVLDGGRFWLECIKRLSVAAPQNYIHTIHFGSVGLGMAEAIGAGVGRSDRPVLMVTGDGGFMLGGLSEFNAAVRHGVDLIVAVFNDDAYGAEHIQFTRRGMDPALSVLGWPDLAPVAEALGGLGITIRSTEDFSEAARIVAARDRPVLIDIKLDPADIPFDK